MTPAEPDGANQSPPRRRVALVANDKAGGLLADANVADALNGALAEAQFEAVPIPPGPLMQRLAQACAMNLDLIVVAGGDGTMACAAQALAGHPVTLGLIPAGTMNLLAKDLGIPVNDPPASIRVLSGGVPRPVDVGVMTGADSEQHVFLCATMFGSPARLGRHREVMRREGSGIVGWLRFAQAFLRAARRHRALSLSVTMDGVKHRIRTPSLTVTVNALDDATDRMFGRSRLDGGELFLYALRHRSVAGFVRVMISIFRRRIADEPDVTVLHGKDISIAGRGAALRVMADGEEYLLPSPVRLGLLPHRLTIMAPAA